MFKSFRGRMSLTFMALIILVAGGSGLASSLYMKNFYMSNVESNLAYDASLVGHMIDVSQGGASYQKIAALAASDTDARVTIIDKDGKVLADSQFDPTNIENHKSRPEIYQALQGQRGVSIRLSETAKVDMLYVAILFQTETVSGVVRVAKPLYQIQTLYNHILMLILWTVLGIGTGALALSLLLARRFASPLKDVTNAVEQIAQGNLNQKVSVQVDDELGSLVNSFNDMAERLRNNMEEISQVKNRLEAVLENTVNALFLVDNEGRLSWINTNAVHLLSIDSKQIGKKIVEVLNNYSLLDLIDNVLKERRPKRQEIVLRAAQGEKILEVNLVPVLTPDRIYQPDVLVVLNDISELKRLQQVRQDFVANVSHELKTPVATISGFAETLVADGKDNPETVREFSQIIYDEAQRLSKMIAAMLELSRLEKGYQELDQENFKLLDIINSAVSIVRKRVPGGTITVEAGPESDGLTVLADRDMIVQAVINLLENALNHSPEGAPVQVKIEKLRDDVRVSVIDQGEGIPDKDQSRIFERFYRVDKARSRKTGGTGLGLAIVKHLIENNGGKVGVKSSPGTGSTFYFTLSRN
jgi:two-component system phosphate regulon sensor histidine kinase PhoR